MIGIAIANSLGLNKLSVINADAQAFLTAAGITGTTQVDAVNTLVNGLQQDGLWSKMKAIYPFVTDNYNLFNYTEDLTNVSWFKNGVTVTSGQLDPNGGTTAFRVQGTTLPKVLYQSPTLTTGQTYTLSFYVKRNGSTNQTFRLFGNNSVISPDFTATSSWQQFTLTLTGTSGLDFGIARDSANNNYDILVWHPQLELGSTATTYQPILTTQQAYISSQFKYNLKDPRDVDAAFRLVFNGGWTHSSTGATPNGTNGYADTKLNPSSSLSTSSAHFAKYNRTNDLVGNKIDGAVQSSNGSYMQQNYSAGNAIIGGVATIAGYVQSNTSGLFTATRTSNSSMKVLKNNNVLSTNIVTTTILPSFNFYIGARNDDGTPFYYNTYQAAFASIGDGLTDTEAANLYTRVNNFQVALSRNV